jgi:hypothetical protein
VSADARATPSETAGAAVFGLAARKSDAMISVNFLRRRGIILRVANKRSLVWAITQQDSLVQESSPDAGS